MKLGDPIRPTSQPIDTGTLFRLFKALPAADPSNLSTFGGPSPVTGKTPHASLAASYLAIEGGFGVSTSNAETTWGKQGMLLRKNVRIDKCPWPDGQEDIRVRCTIDYAQSVGGVATSTSASSTTTLRWNRNTTFEFDLVSGTTPANASQAAFGFSPGSATIHCKMQARGVGPGHPLVQDDGNPYTDTFVTLEVSNPVFTEPATFWYTAQTRNHQLPCPHWSVHHINFPGDSFGFFEAASFAHGAIGLVMSVSWTMEAVGWDTGFDDDGNDVQGFEYPDAPGGFGNIGVSP